MRNVEYLRKGDKVETAEATYEIVGFHGRYNYTVTLDVLVTEYDFEAGEEKEPYSSLITIYDLEQLAKQYDMKNHCFRYTEYEE